MFGLLSILRDVGYHVTFVSADLDRKEPYTRDLQQLGVEVLYGGVDVTEHLKRLAPIVTTCVISRLATATTHLDLLKQCLPDAKYVFDTVDLHFVREARRLDSEGKVAKRVVERLKQQELDIARSVDQIWVVSEDEEAILAPLLPGQPIAVIPNVHDEAITKTPFAQRKGLLFIGSFLHPPNAAAVVHFVSEIFPLIQEELPGVHFYVVGTRPGEDVRSLASESITVTGWVKDISPYLERCRVAVAPLTYGAGLKGKVGHTMGSGLPTVMTPVAAEGMNLTDGVDAFIAEDPLEFATKVVRLHEDEQLWTAMRENGIRHIERELSPRIVKERVIRALKPCDIQ